MWKIFLTKHRKYIAKDLTRCDLANQLNVSVGHISNIKNRKKD